MSSFSGATTPSEELWTRLIELVEQGTDDARDAWLNLVADFWNEPAHDLPTRMARHTHSEVRRQPSVALRWAEWRLKLRAVQESPSQRARVLLDRANALYHLGQFDETLEASEAAAQAYREAGDEVMAAVATGFNPIAVLLEQGRYGDAHALANSVRPVLEQSGLEVFLATLRANEAVAYQREGNLAQALELYTQAGKVYQVAGINEGRGGMALNRAIVLGEFMGEFQAAEEALAEARAAFPQDSLTSLARVDFTAGGLAMWQGRFAEAHDYLQRARTTLQEIGDNHLLGLLAIHQARCYRLWGRLRQADLALDEAVSLLSTYNLSFDLAKAYAERGVIHQRQGRDNLATDALAAAAQLFAALKLEPWTALVQVQRAHTLVAQERWQEAADSLSASIGILQQAGMRLEAMNGRIQMAYCALGQADYTDALQQAETLLAELSDQPMPIFTHQAEHIAACATAALGRHDEARNHYQQAVSALERLSEQIIWEYRAPFLSDKLHVYQDAVLFFVEQEDLDTAIAFAERAKSRTLIDLISRRLDIRLQAQDAEDEELLQRLRAARERLQSLERLLDDQPLSDHNHKGFTSPHFGEAYGGETRAITRRSHLQPAIEQAEQEVINLWERIRARHPQFARNAQQLQTYAIVSPIPYLDKDTALIEYYAANDRLLAFVFTHEGFEVIPDLGQMSRLAESDGNICPIDWLDMELMIRGQDVHEPLQICYDALLRPLEAHIAPYKHWIIVPDGVLHRLPFHALHDGRNYVIENREISYLPTSSLLSNCMQQTERQASNVPVVIAYAATGDLPHTRLEAQSIASIFPDARVFLENKATWQALQDMAPYSHFLHLAAHGHFREDEPLLSEIRLADQSVRVLDILGLELNCSLVTLSACWSAQHEVSGGDEWVGLARAFLRAGAASLLVSLWLVYDRTSPQLMSHFYRALQRPGMTKAAALREAQLSMINQHPFYWASFCLVGGNTPL